LSLPQRMWIESKTDNIPRYRAQACHRASKKRKLFHSKQAKTWVIVELMLSQGPSINSSSPALKLHEAHVEVSDIIEKFMVDEAGTLTDGPTFRGINQGASVEQVLVNIDHINWSLSFNQILNTQFWGRIETPPPKTLTRSQDAHQQVTGVSENARSCGSRICIRLAGAATEKRLRAETCVRKEDVY